MNIRNEKVRNLLILSGLALLALFIVYLQSKYSQKQSLTKNQEQTSDVNLFRLPSYSSPPLNQEGQLDLNAPEVKKATEAKTKLASKLPIYLKEYKTSVGITTTINIFSLPQDPGYLIHVDIYGINFQNKEADETKNPQATAFKESFVETKRLLEDARVDIHDIYFVFGGREYIQETAEYWIKTFGLL